MLMEPISLISYTEVERRIMSAMRRRALWSPEQLAVVIYKDRAHFPKHWRKQVLVIMRGLTRATAGERERIVMVAGGPGRGRKAMWEMRMN
jgi:hypothetical protein